MRLGKPEVHSTLYYFGLLLFAAAIPLSNFMMSLAQWILVANFFIDPRLPEKLKRLLSNKAALFLIGIWLLHVIGLIWTNNLSYSIKDLRVKLPLLIVPFIMAGEPLINKKTFIRILSVHSLAVLAGSLVVMYGLVIRHISDPREASVLISHIRFSLNVCVAIFTGAWCLITQKEENRMIRLLRMVLLLWLLVFLFILGSFTGIAVIGLTGFAALLRFGLKGRSRRVKIMTVSVIAITLLSLGGWFVHFYMKNIRRDPVNPAQLEWKTPNGNNYLHILDNQQVENGHYLWMYVCDDEMRTAWNLRSNIPFDSLDRSGQPLRFTLVRFLTSKGLRKDMQGVESLGTEEIRAIEKGTANVKDLYQPGFIRRIETVIWEIDDYRHTGDPTNHSLMQRVELWRTALRIIRKHPLAGVGTGDVPGVFSAELELSSSPLKGTSMRSHNQYLSIAVALGIPALLYFLFALFYGPVRNKRFTDFNFFCFMIIGLLSMLTEDTLETQPGVSFFIFFFMLFFLGSEKRNFSS